MKVLLTDVSVFFDLYEVQLLPEFFGMDWEILTTDVVYDEIKDQSQQNEFAVFVRSNQLKVIAFSPEEIEKVFEMQTKYSIRTIADKSLIWKAKEAAIPLLSCDGKLRKEAKHQKIACFGSLWVIERMVEKNAISKEIGIEKLEELKRINLRLPENKIDELIERFKK